jgi:hypothetical protein
LRRAAVRERKAGVPAHNDEMSKRDVGGGVCGSVRADLRTKLVWHFIRQHWLCGPLEVGEKFCHLLSNASGLLC